jgi:hypothetical protein
LDENTLETIEPSGHRNGDSGASNLEHRLELESSAMGHTQPNQNYWHSFGIVWRNSSPWQHRVTPEEGPDIAVEASTRMSQVEILGMGRSRFSFGTRRNGNQT